MDHYEVLFQLTTIDKSDDEGAEDFNTRLQQILQKVQPMLTQHDTKFITNSIRYQYVWTIIHELLNIKASNSVNDESLFSVKQFKALKVSIELITAMGIFPGLLPGVGINMAKLCPRVTQLPEEKLSVSHKYERLQFSVRSLMELYNDLTFRPAILAQIGPLLAALLQVCYAPLMKPKTSESSKQKNTSETEFEMTEELYNKLKNDQEYFTRLFNKFLSECPVSTSMRELMVILGVPEAPAWLRFRTRQHLVQLLMQPNGVISLVAAVCEDVLDLGEHWNKLDTVSRLIVVPPPKNSDKYYESICSQLLNILTSTQVKHAAAIAICCITALYEYNREIFDKNIMDVICDPLIVNANSVPKSESEVEKCIESLTKCFTTIETKLPVRFLMKVALPLFCLYNNVRQSACVLKYKIKQLILHLLYEDSLRDDLFADFLGHGSTKDFGKHLASKFGPTGGIEITGIDETLKYEEFADTLLDLTSTTKQLSNKLFHYLLKFLAQLMLSKYRKKSEKLLRTEDDVVEEIGKQLAAVKLLSNLADISTVQETQLEHPHELFCFVETLFNSYIKYTSNMSKENDCEILCMGLMLIKLIINERKQGLDWEMFKSFVESLDKFSRSKIPKQLASLTKEVIELIKTQDRLKQKHYQDLSVDYKSSDKFEEALKDLTDSLLPVRAHGLMTLTKLIENADSCTINRREIILQLFKENLKHEDSFIYLTAINGLCTFAVAYPQIVIETLVQEYIDMPQRISIGELTAETRMKLGEILVKVTRGLGEMVSVYKNLLINGFLCATRDPDSLVRSSSLSCLGELCKVLGFRLGDTVLEVMYCITCIIKSDKAPECRRAAVMTSTLLLRGIGKDTLTTLGKDLVDLYRGLKYLRDNDQDPVLRLHAHLALEELNCIVQDFLFSPPKLEKKILLLNSS
ncbi:transport and golgi organization 6 [Osmia lignaria lignaria]|uniref:transport and golgi organization 6 n=1 Tax=Osmia lignaria lignaria TaxID=1437193 RepID=UPI0014791E69|nr:transport and Golgi organization protein 6 homolog [Osmia lignaria]